MLNLTQNRSSIWVASSTDQILTPTAVALGKFDGVHLGHQRVIEPVRNSHPQDNIDNIKSIYSTVVTFDPHPEEFFSGQPRSLLTPLVEKIECLQGLGIDQLVLLPFDRELSALSPRDFVEKILVQQLQCQKISVGEDFCFGQKRLGTARDLQILAGLYNIPVNIVPIQMDMINLTANDETIDGQENRISTSLIRESLSLGDIPRANRLLGRPYTLSGIVVTGKKLGRTIGFPTANLQLPQDKFLPRQGVYAVRILIDTIPQVILGVMNIGNRPTVNGYSLSIEVHLFDWEGDLYGKQLVLELVQFLRPEQKFPNLEALKQQIGIDCVAAKHVLAAS